MSGGHDLSAEEIAAFDTPAEPLKADWRLSLGHGGMLPSSRAGGHRRPTGNFGAASKPRVLDAHERRAIEDRLRSEGMFDKSAGILLKSHRRAL